MKTVKDGFDTAESWISNVKNSESLRMYRKRQNNEKDEGDHRYEKPKMKIQSQNYTWSEEKTRIIGS